MKEVMDGTTFNVFVPVSEKEVIEKKKSAGYKNRLQAFVLKG